MNADALAALLARPGAPPALGPQRRPGALSADDVKRAATEAMVGTAHPRAMEITALALLWHDHLDAAHELVQERSGAEAAWVHGLMHRREPDHGNAEYWFRRVGRHPAYPALARAVAAMPAEADPQSPHDRLMAGGAWDALAFNDAVAEAGVAEEGFLRAVQAAEFTVLLRHLADLR
ncbi:MAG: hypothetical protein ACKVYV_09955 [Limisphaerales bacterium]